MQIGQADIHVAEYVTKYLPPALLEQKLHEAKRRGLAQLAAREREAEDEG